MTTPMRRKLERLQSDLETIKPKPPRQIRLVAMPRPDADAAEHEAYAQALAWAKEQDGDGVSLIVLTPLTPARREVIDGVEFVGDEVEAKLKVLSLQASAQGMKSRLDDVLQGLSGNVLGAAVPAQTQAAGS